MIYPTLQIEPDQSLIVNIYDTDYPDEENPIMAIQDMSGEAPESFITLLTLFMNQYENGWEDGYATGLDDSMEGVEDY